MIKKIIIFIALFFLLNKAKVFTLKNSTLDQNKQNLIKDFWQKLSTNKITFDEVSKKIFIFSEDKKNLKIVEDLLLKIDKPRKSIALKVTTTRILNQTQGLASAVIQNVYRYGINWFGIYNRNQTNKNFTFQGLGGTLLDFPTPTLSFFSKNLFVYPTDDNIFTITDVPRGLFLPLTFGYDMAKSRLSPVLNLLNGDVIITSEKSTDIITIENQTAQYAGQNAFPIYTLKNQLDNRGQIYQLYELTYKHYGIHIKITPRIVDKHTVTLKLIIERIKLDNIPTNLDPTTGVYFVPPIFGVYRVKETITLNTAESLVISTTTTSNKTAGFGKVPFLCKIPIIGKIFSSTTENTFNDDEIIVITPTIIE